MLSQFKKVFYFPFAWYFRFFAAIRLRRWNPRIVIVTGSNGKTTLLHLLESQLSPTGSRLREGVKFSHHANSSYGIPFDILGLHRKSLMKSEWISLLLKTPFLAFRSPPEEKIYIVEADCDRPGEGRFLAEFLRPEVVLWVSVAHTHTLQFDNQVGKQQEARSKKQEVASNAIFHKKDKSDLALIANIDSEVGKYFETVEEAVAFEFGYFLEYCKKLAVINGDLPLEVKQLKRTKAKVVEIKRGERLKKYEILKGSRGVSTIFTIDNRKYSFAGLLPEELFYSIAMCLEAIAYLGFPFDSSFSHFVLPPGRNSIFAGVKGTTIVDSCYNANLASMKAVLAMFALYPAEKKWVVIGDMLEQGRDEQIEHEKLAEVLAGMDVERILLLGPRVGKYTYREIVQSSKIKVQSSGGNAHTVIIERFLNPKEVLDYLENNIVGGEAILFKGARFMEGVIEHLLSDKKDVAKLSRREKIWDIRRKQWGL